MVISDGDFLARNAKPRRENCRSLAFFQVTQAAKYDPNVGNANTLGLSVTAVVTILLFNRPRDDPFWDSRTVAVIAEPR